MTVMYALTVRALQAQLREQRRMTVTKSYRSASTVTVVVPPGEGSSSATPGSGVCPGSRKNSVFSQTAVLLTDDGAKVRSVGYNSCLQRSPQLFRQSSVSSTDNCSGKLEGKCMASTCAAEKTDQDVMSTKSVTSPRRVCNQVARGLSVNEGRYLAVCDGLSHWDSPANGGSQTGTGTSGEDSDSLASGMPSSPRHGTTDSPDTRLLRYRRSFTFRRSISSNESGRRAGPTSPDKGRRAVQVLGIIFAVFVACYLPFFALYIVKVVKTFIPIALMLFSVQL